LKSLSESGHSTSHATLHHLHFHHVLAHCLLNLRVSTHVMHQIILKLVVLDLVCEEHIIGKLSLLNHHVYHHGHLIALRVHRFLLDLCHLNNSCLHVVLQCFHHLVLSKGRFLLETGSSGLLKFSLLGSHHELRCLLVRSQHAVSDAELFLCDVKGIDGLGQDVLGSHIFHVGGLLNLSTVAVPVLGFVALAALSSEHIALCLS
jgi:hypothetical protein